MSREDKGAPFKSKCKNLWVRSRMSSDPAQNIVLLFGNGLLACFMVSAFAFAIHGIISTLTIAQFLHAVFAVLLVAVAMGVCILVGALVSFVGNYKHRKP